MTRVHAALRRGQAHRQKQQFIQTCTRAGVGYLAARRGIRAFFGQTVRWLREEKTMLLRNGSTITAVPSKPERVRGHRSEWEGWYE